MAVGLQKNRQFLLLQETAGNVYLNVIVNS